MIKLSLNQTRVIGCLMEKSVTTPDQYPLTLNAMTSACNQKSSRDPVMSLSEDDVERVVRQLMDLKLVTLDQNLRSRAEKYQQRMFNTPFAEIQLSEEEFAIICVLLLRGPATPGELRTRCQRLSAFEHNAAVAEVLAGLIDREQGALVTRLPRRAGRQDHEYAHLFSGEVEFVEPEPRAAPSAAPRPRDNDAPSRDQRVSELESRVAALEQAIEELKNR